jgi:hypothetical protein
MSFFHWLIVIVVVAIYGVPIVKILQRAGFSGWWALALLIPLVNIAALWVFAFTRWPAVDRM